MDIIEEWIPRHKVNFIIILGIIYFKVNFRMYLWNDYFE